MSTRDFYMQEDIETAAQRQAAGEPGVSSLAAYLGRLFRQSADEIVRRRIQRIDDEIRSGRRNLGLPGLGEMIRISLSVPQRDTHSDWTGLHKVDYRQMALEDPHAFAELVRIQQELPDRSHGPPWTLDNLAGLLSRTPDDFRRMLKGRYAPILQSMPKEFFDFINQYHMRFTNIPEYNPYTDAIENYDSTDWINSPGTMTYYTYHKHIQKNHVDDPFTRPDNRPWETLEVRDMHGNIIRKGRQPGTYSQYYKLHDRLRKSKVESRNWPRNETLPFVPYGQEISPQDLQRIKKYEFDLQDDNSWNVPLSQVNQKKFPDQQTEFTWEMKPVQQPSFKDISRHQQLKPERPLPNSPWGHEQLTEPLTWNGPDLESVNNRFHRPTVLRKNIWEEPIDDYELYDPRMPIFDRLDGLNIPDSLHNIEEFRDRTSEEHNYDEVLTDGEIHGIAQDTISQFVRDFQKKIF